MADNALVATNVESERWYKELIADCRDIVEGVEHDFVFAYHSLGKRILDEYDNLERQKAYGKKILQCIGESLGKSERTIQYAVQFAREYPDLDGLPDGIDSWYAVCTKLLPAPRPVSYHVSSDSYEWFTPKEYIEAARSVMGGIDLDPASSDEAQTVVKAKRYYTRENDGLDGKWSGRVWLNPPYSMPLIEQFVDRVIGEYKCGNVTQAIVLTNNSTDTEWFHELLQFPVCLTRGRIRFWNGKDTLATRQGQALFYLGDRIEEFASLLGSSEPC